MHWIKQATTYFNPRPPRGGRPGRQNHTTRKDDISIHALREEGDQHRLRCRRRTAAFQSTPSVGKATGQAQDPGTRQAISIRNLHMEGDYRQADCLRRGIHDFNPRPPRGERLLGLVGLVGASCISIHALREEGDVVKASQCADPPDISIHALREEGDQCGLPAPGSAVDFNPRPPRGGRRYLCWQSEIVTNDFNPRPPRGGRRLRHQITVPGLVFQSTPSARRATTLKSR